MLIRMLAALATDAGTIPPGTRLDRDDDEAARLIAAGLAEEDTFAAGLARAFPIGGTPADATKPPKREIHRAKPSR